MNDKKHPSPSNEPSIDAEEILSGVLEWVGIESPSLEPRAKLLLRLFQTLE